MAALARRAAQQQCREDVGVCVHARSNIGHRDARLARRLGRAGDRQKTGLALNQQVIRLFVAVGAVGAVAADVADDEFRELRMQRLERQPHARRCAGCQVLHQHVGRGQQLHERIVRQRLLQVERKAFLAAVDPREVRRLAVHALVIATCKIARAGALHLDHARAQIGELACAERRGHRMFERHHGDAVKRARTCCACLHCASPQNDRGSPRMCSAT
ncbi:hypothetical protein SDC9_122438 [bioreactor metagenome]|uniref:Uncharacterized protein n=1 Tax=bioreactor metagenome TaxID=1076179 RepID=A0A645CEW7_9ZZZZ